MNRQLEVLNRVYPIPYIDSDLLPLATGVRYDSVKKGVHDFSVTVFEYLSKRVRAERSPSFEGLKVYVEAALPLVDFEGLATRPDYDQKKTFDALSDLRNAVCSHAGDQIKAETINQYFNDFFRNTGQPECKQPSLDKFVLP